MLAESYTDGEKNFTIFTVAKMEEGPWKSEEKVGWEILPFETSKESF